jgi:hypothetical protein
MAAAADRGSERHTEVLRLTSRRGGEEATRDETTQGHKESILVNDTMSGRVPPETAKRRADNKSTRKRGMIVASPDMTPM